MSDAERTISEVTRRAIIDYLSIFVHWCGALEEHEFLARIYDLKRMPSTDYRKEYGTAYLDIWQHRIRNQDWTDDWVFTDSRFDLLFGPDVAFLKFLAETVHPVVRPDSKQVAEVVTEYNTHLSIDGWELYVVREISKKPVFGFRRIADGTQQPLEGGGETHTTGTPPHHPKAFVSHATTDHPFVEKFAADLRANGVDAWFSKWEITPGDSIRAKIEEGLEGCEYFIIVLSKSSITRPWVQKELDAATVRNIGGKVRKIIPVKIEDCGDLPPTLGSLCWEDFSSQPYDAALKRVLDSIFERDVRPSLGHFAPGTSSGGWKTSDYHSTDQKVFTVDKNAHYYPSKAAANPAGQGGHELRVELSAPGPITKVEWVGIGQAAAWIHEISVDSVDGEPGKKIWKGWTNSADPASIRFTINHQL
jgi:hypothetical protein